MIYKITIVHGANRDIPTTCIYAHPRWEYPLNEDGDLATAYKVVFHVEEDADRDYDMKPTVFKTSHYRGVYFQLPQEPDPRCYQKTRVHSVERIAHPFETAPFKAEQAPLPPRKSLEDYTILGEGEIPSTMKTSDLDGSEETPLTTDTHT